MGLVAGFQGLWGMATEGEKSDAGARESTNYPRNLQQRDRASRSRACQDVSAEMLETRDVTTRSGTTRGEYLLKLRGERLPQGVSEAEMRNVLAPKDLALLGVYSTTVLSEHRAPQG